MKRIKISKITKRHNGYAIYLGATGYAEFDTKAKAKEYLKDINKKLNNHYEFIPLTLGRMQSKFGQYYTRMTPSERESIITCSNKIHNALNLAQQRCEWKNGNSFTFIHIRNAYGHLLSMIGLLYDFADRKRDRIGQTVLRYHIEDIEHKVKYINEIDEVRYIDK